MDFYQTVYDVNPVDFPHSGADFLHIRKSQI